jgi:hypothetical protein
MPVLNLRARNQGSERAMAMATRPSQTVGKGSK